MYSTGMIEQRFVEYAMDRCRMLIWMCLSNAKCSISKWTFAVVYRWNTHQLSIPFFLVPEVFIEIDERLPTFDSHQTPFTESTLMCSLHLIYCEGDLGGEQRGNLRRKCSHFRVRSLATPERRVITEHHLFSSNDHFISSDFISFGEL